MRMQYYKADFRDGEYWVELAISPEYSFVINGGYQVTPIKIDPPYAKYKIVKTGLIVEHQDIVPDESNSNSMKVFEIWAEGYAVTGGIGCAQYIGSAMANDFKEACIKLFKESRRDINYFNSEKLTYWACKLFDNENDARKSFG